MIKGISVKKKKSERQKGRKEERVKKQSEILRTP